MTASEQLFAHFSLRLPDDLAAWLNDPSPTTNELFNEPESVAELIDPESNAVLAGLMLPDTLPILGDGMGDKLLARFNFDGTLKEIVRWWHEESAWLPCGSSIGSALAYLDAVEKVEEATTDSIEPVPLLHLQVCQFLQSPLHRTVGANVANRLSKAAEMPWREFRGKMFDPAIFPRRIRENIAAEFSQPVEEMFQQDWESAATAAKKVISLRTDLAWPFAVAGWAAERAGQTREAVEIYLAGLNSFESTGDLTKSWEPAPASTPNFCLHSLIRLSPTDMPAEAAAMIKCFRETHELKLYWNDLANTAAAQQRWKDAYRYTLHAGWDGTPSDEPAVILNQLAEYAESAGSHALTGLATHHRDSVK